MKNLKFIIILLVTVFTLSGCDWLRSKLGMATSSDLESLRVAAERRAQEQKMMDSVRAASTANLPAAADSVNDAVSNTQDETMKPTTANTKPTASATTKRFYIIAGSFKDEANARAMYDNLVAKQYTPYVLKFKNGFTAVAVDAFDDFQAAIDRRSKILDKDFASEDVWIYDSNQQLHI